MTVQENHYAVLRFRNGETRRTDPSVEIDGEGQKVRLPDTGSEEIDFSDLKAVFFLAPGAGESRPDRGSLLSIEFSDGEVITGIAPEYNPTLPGFYLYPNDEDRVERVFIVASAIVSIDVERL